MKATMSAESAAKNATETKVTVRIRRTPDRRVAKTKTAIHKALFELLSKKKYVDITITALAHEANIDRKTFYTHYRTLDDVIDDMATSIAEQVLDQVDIENFFDNAEENTKTLLTALNEALAERGALEHSYAGSLPLQHVMQIWTDNLAAALEENDDFKKLNVQEQSSISLACQYYAGGLISLYTSWLNSDSALSLDELASLATTCTLYGIVGTRERRLDGLSANSSAMLEGEE